MFGVFEIPEDGLKNEGLLGVFGGVGARTRVGMAIGADCVVDGTDSWMKDKNVRVFLEYLNKFNQSQLYCLYPY